MRNWHAVVVGFVALAVVKSAHAETLGAWTYAPPASFEGVKKPTQHEYKRITGTTFCLLGVFAPRKEGSDLASDLEREWSSIVASTFTATQVTTRPAKKLKSGLTGYVSAASLADAAGSYYGELSVIRERGVVGSLMLVSNSSKTITSCHPAMEAVIESIAFASVAAPAPAPAATATTNTPASAIIGSWSASSSYADPRTGVMRDGSITRQYRFSADGTYRFHSEGFGGQFGSDTWRLVSETGTYKLTGDTLTLSPTKVTGTVHKGDSTSSYKPPVEKMTYAVKKHYFEGIGEWNLVLTPTAKTARDGEFAVNAAFKDSYLYRDQYKPSWKFKQEQ